MATRRTTRRLCTVCREWFRAHRSAQTTQSTCQRECRRKRQRSLAKRRREGDVERHREQERRRQRSCRQRCRERAAGSPIGARSAATPSDEAAAPTPQRPSEALSGPGLARPLDTAVAVSRSGLSAQVAELEREILESWDKQVRLSRAGLVAKVRSKLGEIGLILDQAEPGALRCHAPATET